MNTADTPFEKPLVAHATPIDGLTIYDLPVHGDARGWFKENWQREKMLAIGLPDFGPVQNNISTSKRGATRGIHAEPWDKYISIGVGSVFAYWVDIRQDSKTFGNVYYSELNPSNAVYVPAGVANGFQTLVDNTVYTYLVNDHWSAEATYANVSLFDETLHIPFPIPLSEAEVSDKDKKHPLLADVTPLAPKKILIVGASGQLGTALQTIFPHAECCDRKALDITSPDIIHARRWRDYHTIINAAAYTAVDQAETTEGRRDCWRVNATAVANLSKIATDHHITLVHISSDYVFDGTTATHTEEEPFTPLNVYGQSKAAGDIAASLTPKHYIIRTSWVIGSGNNFIRTMVNLAQQGIKPRVVSDQIGRITFTTTIAEGIKHILSVKAPYGTYNLTNEGESVSWARIAQLVYVAQGKPETDVTAVRTEAYYAGKDHIVPRPLQSTLSLKKIEHTGFMPATWQTELNAYLKEASV